MLEVEQVDEAVAPQHLVGEVGGARLGKATVIIGGDDVDSSTWIEFPVCSMTPSRVTTISYLFLRKSLALML